jgi:histone acetyltransferase
MQKRKVEFMMTYADNLALGYFRKQGFSKEGRIPLERWRGFVKDYEGGAMMECLVHPTIDYARIGDIIRKQKEFIIQKTKELSINHQKHSGTLL